MAIMAKQPILWRSRQFQAGEIIPCTDQEMIDKWLDSGAAIRTDEPKPVAKAKGTTAPGAPGKPVNGTGAEGEMIGRPSEGTTSTGKKK